jgi:hypothetical protein
MQDIETQGLGTTFWIVWALCMVFYIVIAIIATVALARNFGKGTGFAIGLIFLGVIFYPILA